MSKSLKLILAAAFAGSAALPAQAGEITGNGNFIDIHGHSSCAFSGLNDTPEGDPEAGDPGGRVQSFGVFKDDFGVNANDLDPRVFGPHPGYSCNPQSDPPFEVG